MYIICYSHESCIWKEFLFFGNGLNGDVADGSWLCCCCCCSRKTNNKTHWVSKTMQMGTLNTTFNVTKRNVQYTQARLRSKYASSASRNIPAHTATPWHAINHPHHTVTQRNGNNLTTIWAGPLSRPNIYKRKLNGIWMKTKVTFKYHNFHYFFDFFFILILSLGWYLNFFHFLATYYVKL